MTKAEEIVEWVGDAPEAELKWSLRNATDEALMEIIISLLGLLKAYRMKCNVER